MAVVDIILFNAFLQLKFSEYVLRTCFIVSIRHSEIFCFYFLAAKKLLPRKYRFYVRCCHGENCFVNDNVLCASLPVLGPCFYQELSTLS